MKKVLIIIILLAMLGCVHNIKFVNPTDGTTIIGEYNTATKTVQVTLPAGESLKGEYVALTNASIGFGSLFYGANVGSMLSIGTGGSSNGYALLTGDKGSVMEIIFSYSEWTGHGFGVAKTNKGDEYRVIF